MEATHIDNGSPTTDLDLDLDPSLTVKISLPWTWRPVKRRMLPGCELFREGDLAMRHARKLIPLENSDLDKNDEILASADENVEKQTVTIPCSVVGCTQSFTSLLSYENHYKSAHRHTCQTCHRTLPSDFLLDVHIQENHDPLFALLVSRQNMYRCLVESCSDKFTGPDDRRQHMVKVHSYPANFRFHSLKPSPHGQQSRKKKTSGGDMDVDGHLSLPPPPTPPPSPSNVEDNGEKGADNCQRLGGEGEGGEGMEVVGDVEKAALPPSPPPPPPRRVFVHKVPQHFSFGHGVGRGFHRPPGKKKGKKKGEHWHQRLGGNESGDTTTPTSTSNMDNVDMKDMAEALGDAV